MSILRSNPDLERYTTPLSDLGGRAERNPHGSATDRRITAEKALAFFMAFLLR
jgi:hypothetical protein